MKSLADRIRAEVKRQGLTGYAVAKRSGVIETSVARFLRGDGDLSLTSADAILAALGAKITFPAAIAKRKGKS